MTTVKISPGEQIVGHKINCHASICWNLLETQNSTNPGSCVYNTQVVNHFNKETGIFNSDSLMYCEVG